MEFRYDNAVFRASNAVRTAGSPILGSTGAEIGIRTVLIVPAVSAERTATTIDDQPADSFDTD